MLLVTIAGTYQRFKDAGILFPKYLLPWGTRTVLWHILKKSSGISHPHEIFVAMHVNDLSYSTIVEKIMEELGIPKKNLIVISSTKSQVETVCLALKKHGLELATDRRLYITSGDTILERVPPTFTGDAFVDVFFSRNPNYCYALIDYDGDGGKVIEIVERGIISNTASSGLYGFDCPATFFNNASSEAESISEVVKKILFRGRLVTCGRIHSKKDTIVLGTPEEYREAISGL